MENIIALGCSLTAQDGYINYLNSKYNLNILNLAVSAGSNTLQMYRLNNLLYSDRINSKTILLWQLTSPSRNFEVFPKYFKTQYCNGTPYSHSFDCIPECIEPFKEESVALLSNNKYFSKRWKNSKLELQTVIADVYKWSHIVSRIILYLGWRDLETPDNINKVFNKLTNLENVDIILEDLSIVDWCKKNKLGFSDKTHPDKNSYIEWGTKILAPVLFNEKTKNEFIRP